MQFPESLVGQGCGMHAHILIEDSWVRPLKSLLPCGKLLLLLLGDARVTRPLKH